MMMQSELCYIETFQTKHIQAAVPLFTDPRVREYLGCPIPPEMVLPRLTQWAQAEEIYFAVTRKADGAFLGVVDIAPYHEPGRLELSYLFLPQYWGQGYAYDSIRRILAYCKDDLHLTQIVSETQKRNTRSCNLLQRLGYTLEKELIRFGAEQRVYRLDLSVSR